MIRNEYTLYLYNIKHDRYLPCRTFAELNKIRKYYNELLKDNPPHKIWKYVPAYSVIEKYYIKHTVTEVTYIVKEEEIIMVDQ